MKAFLTFILLSSTMISFGAGTAAEEEFEKIYQGIVHKNPLALEIPPLSEETRTRIIDRLLQESQNSSSDRRSIEMILITMGYEEIIKKQLEDVRRGIDRDVLVYAREEAIPFLMPVVESGSTEVRWDADVQRASVQQAAADAALKAIYTRKRFPPETCAWAKEMHYLLGDELLPERMALFGEWWHNNEAAIRDKRYGDAAWLPMRDGKPYTIDNQDIRRILAERAKQRAERRAPRPLDSENPGDDGKTNKDASFLSSPTFSITKEWIPSASLAALLVSYLGWKLKKNRSAKG